MIVVGLTGSIGMGKSTAAKTFRRFRIPLFDADRAVHRMLGPNGSAVTPVAAAFPGVGSANGGIDRVLHQKFGTPLRGKFEGGFEK